MKKFQFSLESLLKLRREKEQEKEILLGKAVGELLDIDGKIDAARSLADTAFDSPALTLEQMFARERLWTKSVNVQKALEKPRSEAADRVEAARSAYVEAHIEWKAMDRLKEKRFAQWKKDARRLETKRLDEVAACSIRRKHLVGGEL